MKRYELTAEAQADIDAITDYLTTEAGKAIAKKIVIAFRASFRDLSDLPGAGHHREELLDTRYRFWNIYSYQIVYLWQNKPIQIIAVVHGSRDLQAFFTRRLLL